MSLYLTKDSKGNSVVVDEDAYALRSRSRNGKSTEPDWKVLDNWQEEARERRVAGSKLGAKRSGDKRRKELDSHCIRLAGYDEAALDKRSRRKAIKEGRIIHERQQRAAKGVRKRVHTDRLRLAMPAWVDRVAMEAIYAEAVRISRETGIPHEVDHIFPLQGKTVCGLHVETNLRVVTRSVNRAKSNLLAA